MFRGDTLGVLECVNHGDPYQKKNSYLAFFRVKSSESFKSPLENNFLLAVIVSPLAEFSE